MVLAWAYFDVVKVQNFNNIKLNMAVVSPTIKKPINGVNLIQPSRISDNPEDMLKPIICVIT